MDEQARAERDTRLASRLKPEVRLSDETIAHLEEKMRVAVQEAAVQLVQELKKPENAEAFFGAFFTALRNHTANKTGNLVLGGIGSVARKGFWLLLLLVALFMAGDWQAITMAWQAYKAARAAGAAP